MCPVAGCGRLHVSEKIDGVWVNAAEKGAIRVFDNCRKPTSRTESLCDVGFLQFLEGQEGKGGRIDNPSVFLLDRLIFMYTYSPRLVLVRLSNATNIMT